MKKQLNKEAAIDRVFRSYGEERFGKKAMARVTSEEVEQARVFTCRVIHDLTRDFGKQEKGTEKDIFCDYVLMMYLTE